MKQIIVYLVWATGVAMANVAGAEVPDEPFNCKVSGEAMAVDQNSGSRQFVIGDVRGTAVSGFGSWFHEWEVDGDFVYFILSPEKVSCRTDGVEIARSDGRVTETSLPSGPGLRYVFEVEDYEPFQYATTVLIEASRNAGGVPVEWEDGSLEGPVFLTVPDELPVTEGSAGNQWATLSFRPTESGDEVRCRYRGTGATALDPSDRYLLESCVGAGRTLAGGEEVEVATVDLHLDGASPLGRTTVSLPARVSRTVSDFYVLLIENDSEEVVFSFYGFVDPATGDLAVENVD